MNLEVLKVIILACQVSMGGESPLGSWSYQLINEYQVECQQDLIKCYEASVQPKPYAVRDCLMEKSRRRRR